MAKEKSLIKESEYSIHPDEPLFVIGIVSIMTHVPVWTLRRLDEMGLVSPKRINKKIRCYSHRQVKTILYIQELMEKRKVNMSGIKVILEMKK